MTVTRTIKTRLAIEGEAEYQAKMRQCSDAIRETSSTLELVTAKYAENANSIEALTEKGDVLQKMYDQQAEKVQTAADALENARKAQEDYARDIITVKEKLADAEKQMQEFADAGIESGEAYEQLENSIKGLKNQLETSEALYDSASRGVSKWKTEVNKAEAALYKTGDALRKNNDALEEAREGAEGAGEAYEDMAEGFDLSEISVQGLLDKVKNISPTVAIATTAIIGATKAAYDFAETYQNTASVIGKATGAIGDDLYKLTDTAYRAAGQVNTTLEDVAAATGEINTRYAVTGKELETLTVMFADFARINSTDLIGSIQDVNKIMRNYNVDMADTASLLDRLTVAAQMSGASIGNITGTLIESKAQFDLFGYSLDEAIALMAMAELEGINLSNVMQAFRAAASRASMAGKDVGNALDDAIDAIREAADEQEALNVAIEAFGDDPAQEMVYAIRNGKFELEEWVIALENSEGAMEKTAKATETFADKWQQMKNRIAESVVELRQDFEHLSGATADALTTSEESFAAAAETYDKQSEHIEASAVVVERYVMRLKELEEQGVNTAEQQAEYNRLIEQIKALMPDLNIEIDKQTGLLKDGAEALFENVEAWKEYAKMQAAQEFKTDTQQAYIDALREEQELRAQRTLLLEREAQAQAAYDAEYEKYREELEAMAKATEKNGNAARGYSTRLKEINNALAPFAEELTDVQDQIEDIDDALETNANTLKETEAAVDALDKSYSDLNDGLGDTDGIQTAEAELENYADTLTATAEQGIAALEQLQAEYDEAYASAYASIDGQLGKWKEFKEVTSKEASEAVDAINTALDSQIQFLDSYTENFNNLMSRDIEGVDLLAEKLSDGSEESAAILEGLSEKTDEEIEDIIEKLKDVEEGKEEFSEQVALMETDYAERMEEIKKNNGETMDAIVQKMNDTAVPAYNAGLAVGGKFNEALSSKLEEARGIAAQFNSIFDGMQEKLGKMQSATGGSPGHSHATGLYSVPYDEYPAILHKGERVLTAAEARIYNDQEKYGNTDNSKTVNVGDIVVNDGGNSRKTARAVKRALREVLR